MAEPPDHDNHSTVESTSITGTQSDDAIQSSVASESDIDVEEDDLEEIVPLLESSAVLGDVPAIDNVIDQLGNHIFK